MTERIGSKIVNGYLGLEELPADPDVNDQIGFIYARDDGKLYYRDDGGTVHDLLAGGGGGGGTARQETIAAQNVSGVDTALADTLNFSPTTNAALELFLNGVLQRQGAGADYSISGTTITWLAGSGTAVDLEAGDELIAVYES
jgi:hypothetical protein